MNKMKTKLFALVMAFMPFSNVSVNAAPVPVNLSIVDPTINQEGSHRGPTIPLVGIEDYTLTFSTPCYGYTLELLDEDGDVAYTTIITSTTVNLPATLSGTYQLRLIPNDGGSIYFYGFVLF